jgi:succinate dehydrogenase/fumarate reductase flavoprotein subunit
MNPIVDHAERIMRDHLHPALRLSELRTLVAARADANLDADRLRTLLEARPDTFRLLDPWRGPWRSTRPSEHDALLDPWVVMIDDPGDGTHHRRSMSAKMRASIRWLARGVDRRSAHEVSRWYAIALAERATRAVIGRRAA